MEPEKTDEELLGEATLAKLQSGDYDEDQRGEAADGGRRRPSLVRGRPNPRKAPEANRKRRPAERELMA